MKTSIKRLIALAVLLALMGAGGLAWYGNRPLQIEPLPKTLNVVPGTNLRSLSAMLEREGVVGNAQVFWLLGRILGKAGTLKVGVYTLDRPLTPLELYTMIQRGEVSQAVVQFIEGWNWREVRAALAAQPMLKNESASMSDTEILQAIGAGEDHIEGLLFPDTYFYAPHTSDLSVLRRAYRRQHEKLMAAWETRATGLPYRTPYEALIMASIVEKETGMAFERPRIAGVFLNRLRLGMRLQTDPTVIYGLGERFDGNLRKIDLQRDTPYNTYTRAGLPPTPIAMPSEAAIQAALNPAKTDALYFVARGDGTHVFSSTLEAHNRAVNRYQRYLR
ncbi:endolytic transglycosylase MltG [Thiobacillus sp.]|uniref:endolytic transglycosylase MltG n=1 Tax=Thiobacillus sp. TaxID=924 RepID=UPI0011DA8380|nr:endolytic transglycosylase MltG [Thiobacillus sp.]MBC2731419.1 endolytic transglycosylase MltG [Thiobacillus sp.]MBC2740156.1 endolytic transglycosylase MltG [Thiobacillus sp.]MBC2758369.1 endolytic transglycosylase MltG [Thiobacillus sp.]TXH72759.1 MAG: endolytic transglycosylase MltG [Thiobacillus sp.]